MRKYVGRSYWDTVAEKIEGRNVGDLWRVYTKEVYQQLIDKWAIHTTSQLTLKTDLYDEAISPHNFFSKLESRSKYVIGTDISLEVILAAKKRLALQHNSWNLALAADIRNLALKSESFDQVISNSTLDHFPLEKDITSGLKEIYRILKPGGNFIITLDNLLNPLIYLRNMLPNRMLNKLGITQFYIGRTLSMAKLNNTLELIGFRILDHTFIIHSPRVLAVWIGGCIQKIGNERTRNLYCRLLALCENLERFPTRTITGHYAAVKASKR